MGDSITYLVYTNTFVVADNLMYPTLVGASIGGKCIGKNFGVSGNTTAQMLARLSAITPHVGLFLSPLPVVATIYGGINDSDTTGATTAANLNSMITAIRAAGCSKIVICNIHQMSSSLGQVDSGFSGRRSAIIGTASAANLPLADFHANAGLTDPTDYQSDGLHLKASGLAKLATVLEATLTAAGWASVLHG
jgi:lysophospholipase L1-like esterase